MCFDMRNEARIDRNQMAGVSPQSLILHFFDLQIFSFGKPQDSQAGICVSCDAGSVQRTSQTTQIHDEGLPELSFYYGAARLERQFLFPSFPVSFKLLLIVTFSMKGT